MEEKLGSVQIQRGQGGFTAKVQGQGHRMERGDIRSKGFWLTQLNRILADDESEWSEIA